MRRILAVLALAVGADGAAAQVVTPANCHWVSTERPGVVALWCRAPDGRARPTGQTLAQGLASLGDGCRGGLMYDGVRCVREAEAVAAAGPGRYGLAQNARVAPVGAAPRVMLLQDRRGRRSRGLACIDQRDVTICKPVRHR